MEGRSSERCLFYPSYEELLQILFLRQNFLFLQETKILHIEPTALKYIGESAYEQDTELA